MHYYSHHVGDYHRDTAHLSIVEHGVYRLLMDSYYSTERALPADLSILCRIVRAVSKLEREAVSSVSKLFFAESGGMLRHNRIDRELEAYGVKIQQASDAGKASAAKRNSVTNGQRPFNDRSTTVENPLQRNANGDVNGTATIQEPVTSNHKNATHSKAKKVRTEISDDEWMAQLKANPEYQGIPIESEYSKACEWCSKNSTTLSRRRFANWLTRAAAEKPIAIVAKKPFQSVTHNAPVGGWKSCL